MRRPLWKTGTPEDPGHFRARLLDGSMTVGCKTQTGKFLIPGMVEDQAHLVSHYNPTRVEFPPEPDPPEPAPARAKKPTTGWWLVPTRGQLRAWFVDSAGFVRSCPDDPVPQLWTSKDFNWQSAKKLEER